MSDYGTQSKEYAEAMRWRDWQTCDLIADEHLALVEEITKLKEALREAVVLSEMVEGNTKMPHQHSDPQTRLYCLSERAREFQSKHAAIIAEITREEE